MEAYFATVEAPVKRLVVVEGAGHFALATHQAERCGKSRAEHTH